MSDNNNEVKSVKRGKTNGYNNAKLHAKRNRKFEEACDRQADHNTLTIQEKIAKAKSRRGNSTREIARLTKQLELEGGVKVEAPKTESAPKAVKKKSTKKVATKS